MSRPRRVYRQGNHDPVQAKPDTKIHTSSCQPGSQEQFCVSKSEVCLGRAEELQLLTSGPGPSPGPFSPPSFLLTVHLFPGPPFYLPSPPERARWDSPSGASICLRYREMCGGGRGGAGRGGVCVRSRGKLGRGRFEPVYWRELEFLTGCALSPSFFSQSPEVASPGAKCPPSSQCPSQPSPPGFPLGT